MITQAAPLITVGIPTYNGSKFLAQAIQSVLDQTYTHLEILVLDNCSEDNTPSIVAAFQEKDNRIRYIRHTSNIGYIRNFNLVPELAKGDYVLFFSDDDLYDKDYIKILWEGYTSHQGVAISMGHVKLISLGGKVINDINNFENAKVGSIIDANTAERVQRVIRYGHNREWSWGIILGLHKKEALLKHPYSVKLLDPGTLFYRSIIYEGKIVFNENAIFFKRTGGLSDIENYGRKKVTVKTKFDDVKNEVLQLYFELKSIIVSKPGSKDILKLLSTFVVYRLPVLIKRNFLFTASFFMFLLIKGPYRFIRSKFSRTADN